MGAMAEIVALTMAPDASSAVSVAADGKIRAWGSGAASWLTRRTVPVGAGQPAAVAFSGELLRVLWAADGAIRLHAEAEGSPPRTELFRVPARVRALALSPSGRLAVAACDDGTLRGLDPDTGEFGWTLATGTPALSVAVSSDTGPVVAAFPDDSVRRYDPVTGTSGIVGVGHGIRLVATTPDAEAVIAAGADGVLLRWQPSLRPAPDFRSLGTAVTAIAADLTGDRILAGGDTGRLRLHDFASGATVDFGPAAAAGVPAAEPPPSGDFRGIVDNDVRFTVYRPRVLSPSVWASLLVFAHKTDLVVEAGSDVPVDPVEQVAEMARAHFRDLPVSQASEDARSTVFRGARLRVAPDLPGLRCNPDQAEFDWQEPVHQVVFRLLAEQALVGSVVRGVIRVWCGPLLLGEVSVAISIAAGAAGTAPELAGSAPRYRKIFPSYSHDDRGIVDGFAEAARALGDQYLQDVLALRSGERWRERLPELIQEADIFQLFWSSHSMRSRYCQEEWEYALNLRRPLFVRPLYWEDPMPQDPAEGLPPVTLRELEFVKIRPYLPEAATDDRPAPAARRRRRLSRWSTAAAAVTAAVLAGAVLAGNLTTKTHPSTPPPTSGQSQGTPPVSASATPTSGPPTLPAGTIPLIRLLPLDLRDPTADCHAQTPPFAAAGLIQALACDDPGLPGGRVFAFQTQDHASYLEALAAFNTWWGFETTGPGLTCPPGNARTDRGLAPWHSSAFPARSGQVIECQWVGSSGNQPAYAWTYPTENAFLVAQGAPGSSFSGLDTWWTSNG